MSDNPYAALGLTKTATQDEIKKAYRKLVRTAHPDLNPDDPTAAARFVKISAAYDLLKDPETRARFDAGEIDATGAERPERRFYRDHTQSRGQSPGGGQRPHFDEGFDPSDIFAEILRQRGQAGGAGGAQGFSAPGPDLRYSLQVGFLDAALGAKTRITLPEGGNLEVQIPAGLSDGQTLRLRGRGAPGFGGGPAGDALITVSVRPHPVFARQGDDITVTVPIRIDEAVLGAKIDAPTIDGPVSLTIPKGANSGRILRLRGRGVKRSGAKPGDQLVELRVMAPTHPDQALTEFLQGWAKTQTEDPRHDLFRKGA